MSFFRALVESLRARLIPRPTDDRSWGRRGEREAERHLRAAGYAFIARNVRLAAGEIDLVFTAPDRRTIVIAEVKARVHSDANRTPPEAQVGPRKKTKLRALAESLRRANHWLDRPVRFDVIAIEFNPDGSTRDLKHFENAF